MGAHKSIGGFSLAPCQEIRRQGPERLATTAVPSPEAAAAQPTELVWSLETPIRTA